MKPPQLHQKDLTLTKHHGGLQESLREERRVQMILGQMTPEHTVVPQTRYSRTSGSFVLPSLQDRGLHVRHRGIRLSRAVQSLPLSRTANTAYTTQLVFSKYVDSFFGTSDMILLSLQSQPISHASVSRRHQKPP